MKQYESAIGSVCSLDEEEDLAPEEANDPRLQELCGEFQCVSSGGVRSSSLEGEQGDVSWLWGKGEDERKGKTGQRTWWKDEDAGARRRESEGEKEGGK